MIGIGIGPGDPDLITLKGLRALQSAPVLAYPAPEKGESLARAIVAPHLDGHHIEICIRMPMLPLRFPAQEVYDWAAKKIGRYLTKGCNVVCLCEGDPFVYGSFSYLFERMTQNYEVQVIPGVSSITACAAALGFPLATRYDTLGVLPATLDESSLRARLNALDAAAIIKVGRHLGKVRHLLTALGVIDNAYYIEYATMAAERALPLSQTENIHAPYFSMVLVHKRGSAWC